MHKLANKHTEELLLSNNVCATMEEATHFFFVSYHDAIGSRDNNNARRVRCVACMHTYVRMHTIIGWFQSNSRRLDHNKKKKRLETREKDR